MCTFNNTHDRKEAFIVEMNSGAISAGCKHDSCTWGWRELRAQFEPNAYDRRQPPRSRSDRPSPPEVLYEDTGYAARIEAEIDVFAARDRDVDSFTDAPHPSCLLYTSDAADER